MSTLHTVNKSPFSNGSLSSCIAHCKSGDAVLLIEDGVFGGVANTAATKEINDAGVTVYALSGDVDARGIAGKLADNIQTVDYSGFVNLVTEHDRVQNWL